MADKRAGSIFASSFVAGLLLTAGIFAPQAWEPVPEPFFGLEEPGAEVAPAPVAAVVQQPARQFVERPSAPAERLAMGEPGSAAGIAAAAQTLAAPARTTTAAPSPAGRAAAAPPLVAPQGPRGPVANESPAGSAGAVSNLPPQVTPPANGQEQG
ncbi:MAG: hypothetical protein WCJ18_07875, partial [Planctomycetota bacterium]